MLKVMSSLLCFSMLVGCASVNSVSLTPIPQNRTREVRAEVSRTIFLLFNFNNDYLDPLTAKLKAQCLEGVITGILTKDEVISYVLVHKRRVIATGYCVPAEGVAMNKEMKGR